jgi:hypothetical protein
MKRPPFLGNYFLFLSTRKDARSNAPQTHRNIGMQTPNNKSVIQKYAEQHIWPWLKAD